VTALFWNPLNVSTWSVQVHQTSRHLHHTSAALRQELSDRLNGVLSGTRLVHVSSAVIRGCLQVFMWVMQVCVYVRQGAPVWGLLTTGYCYLQWC
jgi:hypothetical protein